MASKMDRFRIRHVLPPLFLVVTACTDVNLSLESTNGPTLPNRQSLVGEVCAPPEVSELPPYKLLFVVDVSGSSATSDPLNHRADAVQEVIRRYADVSNVSFGIILFSDRPLEETAGFTNAAAQLAPAIEQMKAPMGGTDYSDTIVAADDMIHRDLAHLDPATAHRTHYLVYFLTDGLPNIGVSDPNGIVPFVSSLITRTADRVGELRFSTAFLGGAADISPATLQTAKKLLSDMATVGNGNFIDIPAGQTFQFNVDIRPTNRKFVLQAILANNISARFAASHPIVDSDADGLSDDDEKALGTKIDNDDTDGDGYRDGFEALYPERLHPLTKDEGCSRINVDTDKDNLLDCEENIVGTKVDLPDTDGDNLPDGLEVFAGSSALEASAATDSDVDGVPDNQEVLSHMPVRSANTRDDAKTWAYQYNVTPGTAAGATSGPCYHVDIQNLSMYETHVTPTTVRGQNTFEVIVSYAPTDGAGPTHFYRGIYNGRFIAPDQESPANGVFPVRARDFLPFP